MQYARKLALEQHCHQYLEPNADLGPTRPGLKHFLGLFNKFRLHNTHILRV